MTTVIKEIPLHGYVLTRWIAEYMTSYEMRGAEVGVFNGVLSEYLLHTHPKLYLMMVDQWKPVSPDTTYGKSGDLLIHMPPGRWVAIYGRAVTRTNFADRRRAIVREDSVVASKAVPDESLDFVFLDADHSYEGVLADLRAWAPKVKREGFLSGHDLDAPNYPRWGVRRALKDFGITKMIEGAGTTWCCLKSWLPKETG